MAFAPDVVAALGAAAELVNEPEITGSIEELTAFYDRWGYSGALPRTPGELAAVRAVLPELRALLTADRESAVVLVNEILTTQNAVPQLVRHDSQDWHIHAISEDRPMQEQILVETAMAMVDVVRLDETGRLQVCAASDCDGVVIDMSRNRSRRFCSTTCGNREAQAAYRARRARTFPQGSDPA